MSSRWMLRAAAAPERFLARGFAQFLSSRPDGHRRGAGRGSSLDLGMTLPHDLASFLQALAGGTVADFVARPYLPRLPSLLTSARRGGPAFARLVALLAGGVPFGQTRAGEPVVYFLADPPARGLVVALDPRDARPTLICRGTAELAVICSLRAVDEDAEPIPFGIAEEEAVRALVDRGRALAAVIGGTDAQLRTAMRVLALKPLDVPPPECPPTSAIRRKAQDRSCPLALGALLEAFFRKSDDDLTVRIAAHAMSSDAIVRDTAKLLASALSGAKRPALAKELYRRRDLALRAARSVRHAGSPGDSMDTTRQLIARFDSLPPNAETFSASHEREETLLELAELGDRGVAPLLLTRTLQGDAAAVDLLSALGDPSFVPHLVGLIGGEPTRDRRYESAVVRALVAIGGKEARPALRKLLEDNPLSGWREGLERGRLVRELVLALGELEDEPSAGRLVSILESTSQEYRAVLPTAAYALGRLRHAPALEPLERLLVSPKALVTCEALWAVGAIGQAHESAREKAASLLERLAGLEPGAEVTRLAALAKVRTGKALPKAEGLRRAIDRSLWEPAFRQDETSRRRTWGLRALEELAALNRTERGSRIEAGALFLGHEAVRHLVTRDDHRVRRAAGTAFAAWGLSVPKVRPYFALTLPDLERRGGLEALHEAVRDPLGIFRHNVARRLAEIGDPRSVRGLAEATARLFAEPPTSTYEYDDAPPHLVAFVRALAALNRPEGNEVLIDALRSGNHQVRAVVAENAPDDERFVPELMAMLDDPRSFLRSRAERSLRSLGALPELREPATTEVAAVRLVESR